MTRILFVDDEVNVLEGLRGLLRKQRRRWDMKFVVGGAEALAVLAHESFDIVVTDLRMPGVDGFRLLEYLHAHHPRSVRLVLSGDPERETALKLVPRAHRALIKPCKLGELESALESACKLGELVADDALRHTLGKIVDLPPMPQTYNRLEATLADERSSHSNVADVIGADIALSASVLKIANSALFGGGRVVTSVVQAIGLLGTDVIRTIVLAEGVLGRREVPMIMRTFAQELQLHSSVVARVATELTSDMNLRRETFAGAMLHDIGRLVMALELPDTSDEATSTLRMPSAHASPPTPEHARVGAYLLGLWGVPASVIDAVAHHHDLAFDEGTLSPARLVNVAEDLVERATSNRRPTDEAIATVIATAREMAPALATRIESKRKAS